MDSTAGSSSSIQPCRWFNYGYCWRGTACPYPHVTPTTLATPTSAAVGAKEDGKTAATTLVLEDDEDEEALCSICYETPTQWALLDHCSHAFCLPCIKLWMTPRMDQSSAEADAGRTCPACRRKCEVVVPSGVFLPEGEEKEKSIQAYKDSRAKIPCKHFIASPRTSRFCPKGRECLYSHTLPTGELYTFSHTLHDTLLAAQQRQDTLDAQELFLALMSGDLAASLGHPDVRRPGGVGREERVRQLLEGHRPEVLHLVQAIREMFVGMAAGGEEEGRAFGRAMGLEEAGVGGMQALAQAEREREARRRMGLLSLSDEEDDEDEAEEDESEEEDEEDDDSYEEDADEEDGSGSDSDSWEDTDSNSASDDDSASSSPRPRVHQLPFTLEQYQSAAAAGVPVDEWAARAPPQTPSPYPATTRNPLRRPLHPRLANSRPQSQPQLSSRDERSGIPQLESSSDEQDAGVDNSDPEEVDLDDDLPELEPIDVDDEDEILPPLEPIDVLAPPPPSGGSTLPAIPSPAPPSQEPNDEGLAERRRQATERAQAADRRAREASERRWEEMD